MPEILAALVCALHVTAHGEDPHDVTSSQKGYNVRSYDAVALNKNEYFQNGNNASPFLIVYLQVYYLLRLFNDAVSSYA